MPGRSKLIPLSKGYEAIVDGDLFDWLSQWRWHAIVGGDTGKGGGPYARRVVTVAGVRTVFHLHRVICCAPDGLLVDHVNGNTLDNRRENLRLATARQNTVNSYRAPSSSGFRGVKTPAPGAGRGFRAMMSVSGKMVTLGRADTAEAAARIYDEHAKARYGEFARLNFPEAQSQ